MAAENSTQPTKPHADKKPKPSAKKIAAGKAAKKPAEQIKSKADLIRKVAGIIKAKGEKPRPTEIARILKEEGVIVAPAQVSMTLKAAGYQPLRKRRRRNTTAGEAAVKKGVGVRRSSQVSMDDLLAAKSVSGAFGGTDRAIAALQALKRLES